MYCLTRSHTLIETSVSHWRANRQTLTPCDGFTAHRHVRKGRKHATTLHVDPGTGLVRRRSAT